MKNKPKKGQMVWWLCFTNPYADKKSAIKIMACEYEGFGDSFPHKFNLFDKLSKAKAARNRIIKALQS